MRSQDLRLEPDLEVLISRLFWPFSKPNFSISAPPRCASLNQGKKKEVWVGKRHLLGSPLFNDAPPPSPPLAPPPFFSFLFPLLLLLLLLLLLRVLGLLLCCGEVLRGLCLLLSTRPEGLQRFSLWFRFRFQGLGAGLSCCAVCLLHSTRPEGLNRFIQCFSG